MDKLDLIRKSNELFDKVFEKMSLKDFLSTVLDIRELLRIEIEKESTLPLESIVTYAENDVFKDNMYKPKLLGVICEGFGYRVMSKSVTEGVNDETVIEGRVTLDLIKQYIYGSFVEIGKIIYEKTLEYADRMSKDMIEMFGEKDISISAQYTQSIEVRNRVYVALHDELARVLKGSTLNVFSNEGLIHTSKFFKQQRDLVLTKMKNEIDNFDEKQFFYSRFAYDENLKPISDDILGDKKYEKWVF